MPSLPVVDGVPPEAGGEVDVDGEPVVDGSPPDSPDCWLDSPVEPDGCEEGIDGDEDGEDGEDDGDEGGIVGIDGGMELVLLLLAQPPAASAAASTARLARPVLDRCMR